MSIVGIAAAMGIKRARATWKTLVKSSIGFFIAASVGHKYA